MTYIVQDRASAHALYTTHPHLSECNPWREVSRHETYFEAGEAADAHERRCTYPSGCGVITRIVEVPA